MRRPYIIECKKCGKELAVEDHTRKYHLACMPKKKIYRYSNVFHQRKLEVNLRDNFTCQHCDTDLREDDQRRLAVHIDGDCNNNDYNNLITLCRKCCSKISTFRDTLRPKKMPRRKVKRYEPSTETGQMFRGI